MRKNRMIRTIPGVLLLGVALAIPCGALAATAATSPNQALYLKYCGACHGPDGKGDGILSGFLKQKPADLTQLEKQAGGKWDPVPIAQAIDGTRTIGAHGDPDMPVWGEVLRKQGESDPRDIQRTIAQIVDYLHSIQAR